MSAVQAALRLAQQHNKSNPLPPTKSTSTQHTPDLPMVPNHELTPTSRPNNEDTAPDPNDEALKSLGKSMLYPHATPSQRITPMNKTQFYPNVTHYTKNQPHLNPSKDSGATVSPTSGDTQVSIADYQQSPPTYVPFWKQYIFCCGNSTHLLETPQKDGETSMFEDITTQPQTIAHDNSKHPIDNSTHSTLPGNHSLDIGDMSPHDVTVFPNNSVAEPTITHALPNEQSIISPSIENMNTIGALTLGNNNTHNTDVDLP